jgi:hypothetical protein
MNNKKENFFRRIEKELKKEKNWILKKIKYSKFLLLFITFVMAYFLFKNSSTLGIEKFIFSMGYFGSFLTGCFFTYGFTTGPAIAIFMILANSGLNIYIMALLGGFGALLGDLLIFKFIRSSFKDEIKLLENEKIIIYFEKKIPRIIKHYLIPILAGLIIASPLPDELGVSLLAVSRKVTLKQFFIISYLMNTLGILIFLIIGKTI